MRGLKGKTAIVTGGAAGIGAAVVRVFRKKARGSLYSISKAIRPSTSPITR